MFTSALKSFTSNITSNYTLSTTPTSYAGAWKVYDGKKKTTGKEVSVFVFDRKSLEPQSGGLRSRSGGASRRKIHDEVVERLKKEASSLARLRHPNILELAEPVEDTRGGGLMFATEPVTTTLAGLLKDQDERKHSEAGRGRSSRYQVNGDNGGKEMEIDELEIQKGLLQLAKGLEFLHNSAGLVHGNLTPEAIYINQKSDWKISGLGFSGPPDTSSTSTTPPIALSELLYHDPRLPHSVQLNMDYTSPDFVLDSNVSSAADIFSLGLVILALYNSPHESPVQSNSNMSTYKKLFASSSTVPSSNNNFLLKKTLPRTLVAEVLPRLITRRPANRMNAVEFQQSKFFDNILMSTIRFLDALPAKTPSEKSQFMRGLPRILDQFSKLVLEKKILPALLEETKDRELLALILANVFKIIRIQPHSERTFTDRILPKLHELFPPVNSKGAVQERDTLKEAGLVVVLENMALIAEKCPGKGFKDDILPIIQLGLESPTHSVVDKSLTCLPTILGILDFSTVKNDLFPLVAAVFSKTSSLGIKVRGLEAFSILCGGSADDTKQGKTGGNVILDKYTVQEKIVPLLKAIKTKEPAVTIAALSVFKQVGKIADCDFLAIEVLPILWSFSLGPLLNLQQFQEYMDLIKTLSSRIEQEHMRKLRDLASTSNGVPTPRSHDSMTFQSSKDPFSTSTGPEDDFERLVLGKSAPTQPDMFGEPPRPQAQLPPVSPSWSTYPSSSMSSVLHPQQGPSSRAITPDTTLSSFAPLQPFSNPTAATPPSGPSWSTMQPLQPTGASNPWASPTGSIPMSNSWASPPVSTSNSGSAWGNNTTNRMARPGVVPQGSFSIAPPPSMTSGVSRPGIGQNKPFSIAPPAGKVGEKKGLDAYESLI